MNINEIQQKYPHLFQFMVEEFDYAKEGKSTSKKIKMEAFNSVKTNSYPFYKPISKIIKGTDEHNNV